MTSEPVGGIDERELDDAALEALAEAYATPAPASLRVQVLAEARRHADVRRATAVLRRTRVVGAVAATVALVLAGLLVRELGRATVRGEQLAALASANAQLVSRLEEQGRSLASVREALETQGQVLRVIGGPRTLTAALSPQGEVVGGGRVLVDAGTGEAAVIVSGLPPPQAGKRYALWAIRGNRPPEPAGLFTVGAERATAARVERLDRPGDITAFAVSIEPEGGSRSPTGPIVLVGPVAG